MADRDIEIVEVAPRDGLQNEDTLVATADKIALIERAIAAGVRRVEATSFVNPARVPQMADAEEVMAAFSGRAGVGLIGLVLNARGFERAVAAGCAEINFVVVASETFNRRNQGASVAQSLEVWTELAGEARSAGIATSVTIGASFGCPFEGEVAPGRVLEIAARMLESGPDELAFADTIGCGVPTQVRALLTGARDLSPGIRLRCHFHNTRGTGLANAVAAVEAGVDALDCSIGGFGGCPFAPAATGNIATEDVAYMLGRMGVRTGLDTRALIAAAEWLAGPLRKPPPSALTRAGLFPPAAGA